MFAAEADEHDTAIPDLSAGAGLKIFFFFVYFSDALAAAVNYLCDLGGKAANNWAKIGREDMKNRMSTESTQIRTNCDLIVKSIKELKANPYLRYSIILVIFFSPAKKTVLNSAKVIMKHTVSLLQFADLYEIQRFFLQFKIHLDKNHSRSQCSFEIFKRVFRTNWSYLIFYQRRDSFRSGISPKTY
jgi:hypothetical protein